MATRRPLILVSGLPQEIPDTPAFSVHRNGADQTAVPYGTFTKVQFTTEIFDTHNDFDNSTNYRFTPTISGKYIISFGMAILNIASGSIAIASIQRNGARFKETLSAPAGAVGNSGVGVTAVINFNGSSDYVEFYCYHESVGGRDLSGSTSLTFATGAWIGP